MARNCSTRSSGAGLLALCVVAGGLLPGSAAAQEIDPDVKAAVLEVAAAINAGDADRLAESYSEQALRLPPDRAPLSGKDAIRENLAQLFADFDVGLEFESMGAQVRSDLAVVWVYPFNLAVQPKDGSAGIVDHGKWVVVLNKQDGAWKVISDIWNSDLPPSQEGSETET